MNLKTTYLGMELKNPLVASASPLSRELDSVKRLEDAGVSAIVLFSLFEEEILHEQESLHHYLTRETDHYPEHLTFYPDVEEFHREADRYLEHIRRVKESVGVPVIGSLNGISDRGWSEFAGSIQQAGADAIELNVYYVAADPARSGTEIEQIYIRNLQTVKRTVSIPVAMKLGPYFSSVAHLAVELDKAGADALVLFNRFYQPDILPDKLEVSPTIVLSDPYEGRLPLRWIAILHGKVHASLAATTGIHTAGDVIKMIMAGADATMLCSALLRNGIERAAEIRKELLEWMEIHGYESVDRMKGIMSHQRLENPYGFVRANYVRALKDYRVKSAEIW
ncbi:MAG: dihydroorotate dehydrogenase-like protein [Desulfobacteraceae bacterium]|nr:MAG: dihydroorotate dehydrogenase-like protein [Desulfobacteraceae bacterium]